MRSFHVGVLLVGLALLTPQGVSAQDGDRAQEKPAAKPRAEEPSNARFATNASTNVEVDLTITDQRGTAAPEKKTVTMMVQNGTWGRIRSAGNVHVIGNPSVVVDLNVDARPRILVEGPVQLELTIAYSPLGSTPGDSVKPPTVNQSLSVVLQNGKPLIVSRAADPVGDRKIIVEARATIVK